VTDPDQINLIARRNQGLREWLLGKQYTLKMLAEAAGVSSAGLDGFLKNLTMPVERHRRIVEAYHVPSRLLPEPKDLRPGPKPLSAFMRHQPAAE